MAPKRPSAEDNGRVNNYFEIIIVFIIKRL